MILILIFIQIFLAVSVLTVPQLLAQKGVGAKTYWRSMKFIPVALIVWVASFLFSISLADDNFDTLYFIFLSLTSAIFPILTQSIFRAYRSDFSVLGPTAAELANSPQHLNLPNRINTIIRKIAKLNWILFFLTLAFVSTSIWLFQSQPRLSLTFLLGPPLLSLVGLIITYRITMFRLKADPSSEHLDMLTQEVKDCSETLGLPVPKAYVMPSMTTVPYNCFAHPKGLYISDLMLQDFSPTERRFIILHELAHIKLGHIKVRQWALLAYVLAVAVITSITLTLGDQFPGKILVLACGIILSATGYVLYAKKIFPQQEFEADAEAIRTLNDLSAAKSSLTRVVVNSAFPRLMELDMPSHPSLERRIASMTQVMADQSQANVP
jgi:Zn-dependent protease with chaperone function